MYCTHVFYSPLHYLGKITVIGVKICATLCIGNMKETVSAPSNTHSLKNGIPVNHGIETTPADFETAISATGYGKFNFILLSAAIPCGWAAMFDSTAMSYILPAANCDLDLNLEQRGMLNGITYLGMISSAFVWGFLADTLGRKKLLIIGYALDACFVTMAGFSQTYEMLLAAKYMTGFIINGPFAALTSLISEFSEAQYRAKVLLVMGIIYAFANLILPLIAWAVLPNNWDISLLGGTFDLHSWNFFILICAMPSVISAIALVFLPESPKFLMTVGRNKEALKIFQKVYSLNTGNPPNCYPIKCLVDEVKERAVGKHGGKVTSNRTAKQALKEGWQQVRPLFFPPHVLNLILVCVMQAGFMTGANTLRLWLPQIFTTISDYQATYPNDTSATLCKMLQIIAPGEEVTITECVVNNDTSTVYVNVLIVASTTMLGYTLAGIFINKVGKKAVIIVLGAIGAVSGFCIYFAQNVETTTALSAINNALVGICCNVQLAVVVDLFPTSLRTIAISLVLMIGRIGAMSGNVVFPILLKIGCLQPFLMMGCLVAGCVFLTFLLPKTDMKPLE